MGLPTKTIQFQPNKRCDLALFDAIKPKKCLFRMNAHKPPFLVSKTNRGSLHRVNQSVKDFSFKTGYAGFPIKKNEKPLENLSGSEPSFGRNTFSDSWKPNHLKGVGDFWCCLTFLRCSEKEKRDT